MYRSGEVYLEKRNLLTLLIVEYMYLLHCIDCDDVVRALPQKRFCSCGKSYISEIEGMVGCSGNALVYCLDDDFSVIYLFQDNQSICLEHGDQDRLLCTKVIEYLNENAKTKFSSKYPSAISSLILARHAEGATLEDFLSVIDKKVSQWIGTDSQIYLRPKTLFNKTNFQNYVGELPKPTTTTGGGSFETLRRAVEKAKANIS